MANPRWTGFTHTAKAQMQSQDDLPIPSETPLNLKMFNARLTRSLIPASFCGFRLKDFELPIQDESEVQLYNLSVGLLQCSRSGVHRKVGNVALISPTGVPGLDQQGSFTFVLDTSRRVDAKIGSSHSRSEMELSLCVALAQREESFQYHP